MCIRDRESATGATAYAVFKNNVFQTMTTETTYSNADNSATWSVRAANEMGGFGEPTEATVTNGISAVNSAKTVSATYYSLTGMKLSRPQKGINLCVNRHSDGKEVTGKVMIK